MTPHSVCFPMLWPVAYYVFGETVGTGGVQLCHNAIVAEHSVECQNVGHLIVVTCQLGGRIAIVSQELIYNYSCC